MHIDAKASHLHVSCQAQFDEPTKSEIQDFRKGHYLLTQVSVPAGSGSFPIFIARFGALVIETPYCLGLEDPTIRNRVQVALDPMHRLTASASWPIFYELLDRSCHQARDTGLIVISPRFWEGAAKAILASASVTPT
ncbi:hypothetical protein [Pseudooceanicola sp. MF1-13]|uniref:hypothetical protein n=1 Tax=Pseudooceanicola sp. MF1-13 TaxID=3379095 RepID=UPI003891C402